MKRYKDKISVWRGALSMVVLALAFVGCTKESINPDGPLGDQLQIHVVVPQSTGTRATVNGSVDENRLDKIAIFVFDKSGKFETKIFIPNLNDPSVATSHPKWKYEKTLTLPIVGQTEPRNIYVVANWTPPTIDESTYTETMFNAEYNTITGADDINGARAYPMLMSGVKKGVTTYPRIEVNVTRQVAKLRSFITLSSMIQDNNPNIEWLTDRMTITVVSVLDKSYIVGGQSTGYPSSTKLISMFGKFGFTDAGDEKPAQEFPITTQTRWIKDRIYVNESLPSAKPLGMDTSTCIVIHLPYKNHTTGVEEADNYYKVYVGERKTKDAPYRVFRNTLYALDLTILDLGLPFDKLVADVNIEDQLTVLPWEKGGDVDTDAPQNYFNIDRTRLEFQYMAEEKKVHFATDVEDWKLINKADGKTIFLSTDAVAGKSFESNGIKYTLNGTATQATITVTKLRNEAPTIPKQEFTFVARNLKVPFAVGYDNGFIPSSVLSQGFETLNNGTIQGWPNDRLPTKGLQIAKRGDQILPSGVAQADDPLKQWKTSDTSTSGTAAVGVGMGKHSTDAMIVAGADEHPAAKYCREMGPGWYLPSRDELLLIYNYKAALGTSYTFYAIEYWSATESYIYTSWYVHFYNGYTGSYDKTGNVRVRCVREI